MGNHEFAKRLGDAVASKGIKLRTEILFLRPDQIDPDPEQPRQEFDDEGLSRLAESLRKFSQLQPILVRKEGARYILVTGERRWRAAKMAGMATIQCLVCKSGDVRSVQLVENLLREDLQPIEQAKAYYAMMMKEGWKIRELARHLHLEHSRVSKALKLLKLPRDVQKAVDAGKIPPTTAYEIAKRPKEEHRKLAKDAISGKIKGDDLRQKSAPPAPAPAPAPAPVAPKLTLAVTTHSDPGWAHSTGPVRVNASGFRTRKDLVTALERAAAAARTAKLPLLGGLGA